uniref:RING-type domain-containing protein n=1 Tax=viral metagenome TaxID=1070528 RepID=A0A6C0DXP7_9ZZZZ
MNTSNVHESMLQYHENIHEYNENMRRYLQFMYEERSNVITPNRPTATNGRNILTRLIQNILRNRNTRESFEDVVVRPTNQQIQTATETLLFNDRETHNNTSCPISLDVFRHGEEVCRIKPCSHLFKKTALMTWFRMNVVCPVCRYDIRNYVEYLSPPPQSSVGERASFIEPTDDDLYENESATPLIRNRLTDAIRSLIRNDMYNDYEYFSIDLPIYVDPSGN